MDLATIMRRPVDGTEAEVLDVVQTRHVTKRRQKDFNGNHPNFNELLGTDEYTQYRDKARYSEDSTEEDEASEEDHQEEAIAPIPNQGVPDDSFNAAELNKTESPTCFPMLTRRRSFDKNTNARMARQDFKRKSQDKRYARFNTARSKATSQTTSSTNSSNGSEGNVLSSEATQPTNHCNNNLNASDNSLDDVSWDFESLIHNKISEIEFTEQQQHDDNSTDDQLHGSQPFLLTTHSDFKSSDKRVDADPLYISSRLPQLSRPSEMFVVKNGQNIVPKDPPKRNLVKTQPNRHLSRSRILLLTIVIVLMIIFYVLSL